MFFLLKDSQSIEWFELNSSEYKNLKVKCLKQSLLVRLTVKSASFPLKLIRRNENF